MTPVEELRAAARVARGGTKPDGGHWWQLGPVGEPLAAWLENEAGLLDVVARDYRDPETYHALLTKRAETYHGEALAVARVLLGVPDGQ